MIIEYRDVRNELYRFDELHRERLCACCADDPEAQGSDLRRVFERAAAKGNTAFMVCANCAARWRPEPDIDCAVRGWMMILSEQRLVATLCGPCARANPKPATMPTIARIRLGGEAILYDHGAL
jgi:hypothetical protein